jgi:hypothetical protein
MKKVAFAIVAIVGSLIAAPAAQAGFLYVDVFDGTTTLHVVDNDPNDIDSDPNSIIVRSSALLTAFAGKIVSGSGVSSSSNIAGATTESSLSTNYTFKGAAGATTNFTVTSGQTGFTIPGDPKAVSTSASFTFTNGGTGANGSFTGGINPTNPTDPVLPPTQVDSTIAVSSVVSPNPNSGSGNGTGFIFNNGNTGYSMTNVLTAHVVPTKNSVIQGQGTTIVSAAEVPEPSTIVLLATFVGPLAIGAYRRRRTQN